MVQTYFFPYSICQTKVQRDELIAGPVQVEACRALFYLHPQKRECSLKAVMAVYAPILFLSLSSKTNCLPTWLGLSQYFLRGSAPQKLGLSFSHEQTYVCMGHAHNVYCKVYQQGFTSLDVLSTVTLQSRYVCWMSSAAKTVDIRAKP